MLTKSRMNWMAVTAVAMAALGADASAADTARGRALYESRCVACHSTGVHERVSRKAVDFAGIRLQVERWNGQLGGAWGRSEVDDVAVYLNDRFYRYPCPEALCRAGSARRATDGVALARRGGEVSGHLRTRAE